MDNVLREPLLNYLSAKKTPFANNTLADKFRHLFPETIAAIIPDKARYKVVGSPGQGQWTECPWIAIFDILITDSAQSGYYPVFLFKTDMSGVYLSLNQGVTEVRDYYKRDTRNVLRLRAQDFRAKIDLTSEDLLEIELNAKGDAKLYEDGNIIAKYYSSTSIPTSEAIRQDVFRYLNLYEELAFNDTQLTQEKELTAIEKKQYRLHFRIERNSAISKKVKIEKGYICEACNFDFRTKYGDLGQKFIEAHHLKPIASLGIGKFQVNIQTDFAVLCSDCHSMIHRLDDASDLNKLRIILKSNAKQRA
jgi:5-methylcytosine-specific restriction protein A